MRALMLSIALCACASSAGTPSSSPGSEPESQPEPASGSQEDAPRPAPDVAGDPVALSPEIYKVLQENERFRVLVATWAPGQKDAPHRHPRLVVYALTAIAGRHHQGDDAKPFELPQRASTFQAAVKSQAFENQSEREAKMLIVELKPGGAADKPKGKTKDAVSASPDIYKVLLDLEEVRVLRATWKAKQKDEPHAHAAHAVYFLTDFKGREVGADGRRKPVELTAGTAQLSEVVEAHLLENLGAQAEALYFELK